MKVLDSSLHFLHAHLPKVNDVMTKDVKDVIPKVLHKTSICIIKVAHFGWMHHLNGIPLVCSRHVLKVGGACTLGVIPHRLIP